MSFGERLCALLVSAHLVAGSSRPFVDARHSFTTTITNANVIFIQTNRAADDTLQTCSTLRRRGRYLSTDLLVAQQRLTTTSAAMIRYTAAILGLLLVPLIEIWGGRMSTALTPGVQRSPLLLFCPSITYE